MLYNTNTWALSPKAIAIRLTFLILLGFLMILWIDYTFGYEILNARSSAAINPQVFPMDSIEHAELPLYN